MKTPEHWEAYEWWLVSFREGRRVGYGHEPTWQPRTMFARMTPSRIDLTETVCMPKRFYKTSRDLPTRRREIDLYSDLRK